MTETTTILETLPALATHENSFPIIPADVVRVIDPAKHFLPVPWPLINEAAALIASCPGVAPELTEPAAARFVAYQAARWGMDPIAVATKVYFTPRKGGGMNVGYEAQLVLALIASDPELLEPLHYEYGYSDPTKKVAANRFCKVTGRVRGSAKPKVLVSPTVGQIKTKASPLWFSHPDLQLGYYTGRAWARLYRSARLLGVYSIDEVQAFRTSDRELSAPMFEEDDTAEADFGDAIPPGANDAPPDQSDHKPEDLDEVKAWAHGQRDAILAMTDPRAAADAGNAMLADPRFGRLKAYELATAKAIDRAVGGHIKEL